MPNWLCMGSVCKSFKSVVARDTCKVRLELLATLKLSKIRSAFAIYSIPVSCTLPLAGPTTPKRRFEEAIPFCPSV